MSSNALYIRVKTVVRLRHNDHERTDGYCMLAVAFQWETIFGTVPTY